MPNRFDDIINQSPTPSILPGLNRFSDIVVTPATNRFSDLITPVSNGDGLLKKTIRGFGGAIGTAGRILSVGQQATTGVLEKGLEKVGALEDTGIKGTGALAGIKEQKSNIELLRRIGEERGGGLLTGQYNASTSVFGNFIRETPVTVIGLAGDIFLDPLLVAGRLGIVAKGTVKTGELITKGAKVVAEEVPAIQKIGDMLGRAFLTRFGQREAFKNLDYARKIEESLAQEKVGKLVSDVIEKPAIIQQRITQIIKGEVSKVETIAKELQPLAQEARKYKSAEEFVKAQKVVYHGSPFKGLTNLDSGEFAYRGNSFTGKNTKVKPNAIYFSENPDVAKFFGTDKAQGLKEMNIKTGVLKVDPTVYERYLSSKKTLDLTSIEKADKFLYDNKLMGEVESALGEAPIGGQGLSDMIADSGADIKVEELWNLTDNKKIVDTMKKLGYDTVKLKETGGRGTSYAVLDKNSLLTKSQLTDIWNQANKTKTLDPKNFKSAEEFVKAQRQVFHQTTEDVANKIEQGGFKVGDRVAGQTDVLPNGVNTKGSNAELRNIPGKTQVEAFTNAKNVKEFPTNQHLVQYIADKNPEYSKLVSKATELERKTRYEKQLADIEKNWTRANNRESADASQKIIDAWGKEQTDGAIRAREIATDILKKEGYDGVYIKQDIANPSFGKSETTDNLIVFDPANLKTKSQLTDFYNQVTKGVKPIQKGVSNALELTDNELKILAEPIREELDRVGKSISDLNPKLLNPQTFEINKGTYFPRLYTDYEFPKTEEGVVQQAFGSRAVSIPKEPFKPRILTEAESLAKGTRIEEAGYPALKRLTQLNIVEQRQKFFSETAKLASEEAKPGWIQLSEDKVLGDLAGKFLPVAEYRAIAEIRKVPTGIEELYSKALTTWKTFKTAYNPSTIARNDITNFFVLNPLGGVGPHRLDIYAKTVNEIMTKGPLYQLARKEGLEISTQQAAELTQKATKFYKENQGLVKQFFNKVGDFNQAVKNFYGSQDKFFKLANFIKGVTEDGLTPFEALRRANFYLVDYSEVPEAIAWLRKSPVGIPFISFTYGVSKPLAKTLLEHPDKLANYFKTLSAIQQMNPMGETPQERQGELDVTPDWIQTGTTLRLPVKDKYGRGQYVDLQYILPFNILESRSLTPSSPLLNTLAAMLTNKDPFTGKDIVMQTDTDLEKTSKWSTYIIRQIVPSLAPFGYSFNKIVALLQKRPDANGYVRKALPVLIDVLGGIKVTPIDQTIEGQKRAYEKRKQLEELRTNLIRIQTDKTLLPEVKIKESQKVQGKIETLFAQ